MVDLIKTNIIKKLSRNFSSNHNSNSNHIGITKTNSYSKTRETKDRKELFNDFGKRLKNQSIDFETLRNKDILQNKKLSTLQNKSSTVGENLFNIHKINQIQKEKLIKEFKRNKEIKEKEQCTFSPKIHINKSIFIHLLIIDLNHNLNIKYISKLFY